MGIRILATILDCARRLLRLSHGRADAATTPVITIAAMPPRRSLTDDEIHRMFEAMDYILSFRALVANATAPDNGPTLSRWRSQPPFEAAELVMAADLLQRMGFEPPEQLAPPYKPLM